MSDETSRLISDIVHFASPLGELINRARIEPFSPNPTILDPELAKSAVFNYQRGWSTHDDLVRWARFLLGRRDVAFPPGQEQLMLDLLEEIASSGQRHDFDIVRAEVWVSILDHSF